ncbi:hypothetical protein QE152_g36930 [Popillia japonica]|uniref:Uncharacterized protein n=1 Tax=Popillia japonica TaxID=7064 RepID=A0AAW1IC19_POPJA
MRINSIRSLCQSNVCKPGLSDPGATTEGLTLEIPNQPPIPLKKTLSQKDKDTIEKNIRALMNITSKEDSDCEDDIPLLCFDKSKKVENINPTEEIKKLLNEEIKKLLNIQDPRLFETKS